jgi:hypothetical protein
MDSAESIASATRLVLSYVVVLSRAGPSRSEVPAALFRSTRTQGILQFNREPLPSHSEGKGHGFSFEKGLNLNPARPGEHCAGDYLCFRAALNFASWVSIRWRAGEATSLPAAGGSRANAFSSAATAWVASPL